MFESFKELWIRLRFDITGAQEDLDKLQQAVQYDKQAQVQQEGKNDTYKLMQRVQSALNMDTSGLEGDAKKNAEVTKFLSDISKKISTELIGFVQQSFDILSNIYKEMKNASPLLQAIEQIFQLAWMLFFMPLGNKLGEMLIPAVLKLVDEVVKMWDEFGDGGLGEMFAVAIEKGVDMLATFFNNIGEMLEREGGMLGSIGRIFTALSGFIEHSLEGLINLLLNITTAILTHLPLIVTVIGAFMGIHYALQLATIAAIMGSKIPVIGSIIAGGALVGGIGTAAALGIAGVPYMAEGGFVPSTPGGQLIVAGDGGEGEFVIPESKVNNMGRNTYNIYINGYTDSELKNYIKDIINDEISGSRLRSGF